MTLRQKQVLLLAMLGGGLGLLLWHPTVEVSTVGLVLMLGTQLLTFLWMRCPECGAVLGRTPGSYCENCGTKVPWNEKKKRIL